MKKFVDKQGLDILLNLIWNTIGMKKTLNKVIDAYDTYILNINYEQELAFNTGQIIGDNSPYVGTAIVGQTYVA